MSAEVFFGQTICVIGVFDGVHIGHQYLLQQAERQSDELGIPLLVVTFDRDPDDLFFSAAQSRKLLSDQERLARLVLSDFGGAAKVGESGSEQEVELGAAMGMASGTTSDAKSDTTAGATPGTSNRFVLALPFNQELADRSPADFLNQVLAKHCHPRAIHVGADFRFGSKAQGNVTTLTAWAATHGAEAFGHHLLDDGGRPISATRIRDALASGDLAEANRLLTRPHHVSGTVVQGRGRGRVMGFPTANVAVTDGVMQPADGVYAGFFEVEGELMPTAISVGAPPTFTGAESAIEAFILDHSSDLYGQTATVYFVERLRPMIAFESADQLSKQIQSDVDRTRQITDKTRSMFS
ncbi:MAG: bifunctional riboflavin kinase/FMN adenylyltransferase [Coriobacteriia bacterium]|nr:bifunctional riboflavin kinase/FMN adenylyltransferase [Coriobacteriia bacterium]